MLPIEQLNDFRRKIVAGEDISMDSLRTAIQQLVGERLASHATAAPKTKVKAVAVDLDSLLSKPS